MKNLNNQRGITLIALIITIIVLLILAGITISAISGKNGIIQKSRTAKTSTEEADELERRKNEEVKNEIKDDLKTTEDEANYTLIWLDGYTENALKTMTVKIKGVINANDYLDKNSPSNPTREGYQFNLWDKKINRDKKEIIYTATWIPESEILPEICNITINCVDDNENILKIIYLKLEKGEKYTLIDKVPSTIENYVIIDQVTETRIVKENETIMVHYGLDNIGGGSNGTNPDGIADQNQIIIYFTSSNEAYGTVSKNYMVYTRNSESSGNDSYFDSNVTATTTELSRTYFSCWTQGGIVLSTNAVLDNNVLNNLHLSFGSIYQVIANFGRTGSNGGGSGGGGTGTVTN